MDCNGGDIVEQIGPQDDGRLVASGCDVGLLRLRALGSKRAIEMGYWRNDSSMAIECAV